MTIDGNPWLVAVDVLRAMETFVHPSKGAAPHLKALDMSERRVEKLNTLKTCEGIGRGNPNTTLISESGFYKLAMRAQRSNPKAREFQDWVTKVVLPTNVSETARWFPYGDYIVI